MDISTHNNTLDVMYMPCDNKNNNNNIIILSRSKEISIYISFYEITNAYFYPSQVSGDLQWSRNNNNMFGGGGGFRGLWSLCLYICMWLPPVVISYPSIPGIVYDHGYLSLMVVVAPAHPATHNNCSSLVDSAVNVFGGHPPSY